MLKNPVSHRRRKSRLGNLIGLSGNHRGMSVTELMVSICIVGILASVAIPFYINYIQQARVVSIIIPRLHQIETSISLFYSMHNRLPESVDITEVLNDIETESCDIAISSGTVRMEINARDAGSKLHILNGKILLAAPVISKSKIVTWHLSGELAERLKINY